VETIETPHSNEINRSSVGCNCLNVNIYSYLTLEHNEITDSL
jgi:hypothetical protein